MFTLWGVTVARMCGGRVPPRYAFPLVRRVEGGFVLDIVGIGVWKEVS